ncbi:undecaprenyl-diphosphatase [Gemmatimonadetes bacterium T265]|nr:undecaprenyl-diphosphatase [Gemmatimonadetes bacterium T265]
MPLSHALVLGLLQGLAEFLPISSSAHLALAPWLLGWNSDPGLAFDVALHAGTLITLLWYFRADWIALAGSAISLVRRRRIETPEDRRVLLLVIATIPGAIAGKLLEQKAETTFRAPALIAVMLIVMGVLLWAADRWASQARHIDGLQSRDAWALGFAQVAALIPGVSRSGSTMTLGRALQLDRESAARFSFLMSMPIIAGAVVLKLPKLLHDTGDRAPLAVGIVTAALSSWVAITVLLRYLTRHGFGVFAVYRVLLGATVLALIATGVRSSAPAADEVPGAPVAAATR